ncbi:hypothetical protein G6F24_017895 [Rhizopus arrhizus]|nr:hypothetical protein G6F24_017895 [Rhizopus arrhizus]
MHDHRKIELAGQLQLANEIGLLRLDIQPLNEEIQAAFADRAGAFAFDPLAQQRQVPGPVLGQEHRVQAVGRLVAVTAGTTCWRTPAHRAGRWRTAASSFPTTTPTATSSA